MMSFSSGEWRSLIGAPPPPPRSVAAPPHPSIGARIAARIAASVVGVAGRVMASLREGRRPDEALGEVGVRQRRSVAERAQELDDVVHLLVAEQERRDRRLLGPREGAGAAAEVV